MMYTNFYNQSVNWQGSGNYYIHLHQENIGKMSNGTDVGEGRIAFKFNQLKRDNASSAVKKQYKTIFIHNVQTQDVDAISQLFADNSSEALIKQFNDAMQKELQERINVEKIGAALKAEKQIVWDEAKLNQAIKKNNALLALETLDSILTHLAEGVNLINDEGQDIAKVLIAAKNGLSDMATTQKSVSLQKIGKQLKKALAEKEEEWKKKPVSLTQDQILTAIEELKKFSARLKTLKKGGSLHNPKAEDLTAEALKSFTEKNLFSTLVGEAIPTHMKEVAGNTSFLEIKRTLEDIRGTGKDTMALQPSLETGEFNPDNSSWDQPRQIKTDIRFNNVKVDLAQILGSNYGSITMGFGISNKAYKTNSFGGSLQDFGTQTFSAGGGMNIEHGLEMLTSNAYIKYLAYNVFARQSTMPNALIAVQNALFTRSIVYLFGSRNIDDFANFMLINGQFVSLWDIILYATEHNIGMSRSQASSSQGIVMSIGKTAADRQAFESYVTEEGPTRRSRDTNQVIKKAGLYAYIRPAQLAKALQKH